MADQDAQPDQAAAARQLLQAGEPRDAFHALLKAKEQFGHDPKRLSEIAAMMQEADQAGSALELRSHIILALPDDAVERLAYLRLKAAVFTGNQGELWSVLGELDALVAKTRTASAWFWLDAADLYMWLNAYSKRRAAIRKGLAAHGGSGDVMRQVARLYLQDGRRWRAWFLLRTMGKRRDLAPYLLRDFAHISRSAGFHTLSLGFARRLQAAEPGNVWGLLLASQAMAATGGGAKAASALKARLADLLAFQDEPRLSLEAAEILAAGREFEAERSVLLNAARLWPGHSDIERALQVGQFGSGAPIPSKPA